MKITALSRKQLEILKFIDDSRQNIICDGAVRSGKTVVMIIAFIVWGMENFNGTNFAISGKTVSNAERNVLKPFQQIEGLPYKLSYKVSSRMLTVRCGKKENYFYLFGGKDESSYELIQGITLAGVLFDEVALMPQSFVDQAIARTLSYENAKLWFNCNPESPNHWFYREWIQKEEEKDVKHLHFLMEDNPIMDADKIAKAKNKFSGVFYDRYVLGKWTIAEGLIYKAFANNEKKHSIDKINLHMLQYINIGIDIGGNKSNHAIVCTATDRDFDIMYVLKSKSIPARDTDVDFITKEAIYFCNEIEQCYGFIDAVYVDSAEQAIKNHLAYHTKWNVRNSIKNNVIDRIRCADGMFKQGRIKILEDENEDLKNGLRCAVYNSKKLEDERLDDGTSDIDILDAWEYSWEPYIKHFIRR